jgi:hypothetical protein
MNADDDRTRRLLDQSSKRFSAGTTYGGSGRQQPSASPQPPTPPPSQRQVPPAASGPPKVPSVAPRSTPKPAVPQSHPVPPRTTPSAAPAPATVPPGDIIFDVKPYHALRVLIGVWVVVALVFLPGIGYWLTAIGCAVAEWYTRTNNIGWPPDIQDFLVQRRLAAPKPRTLPAGTAKAEPVIPLRAMSISELFGGAVKVVLKNWPALLGIPLVTLVGFIVVFGAVCFAMFELFFNASSAMSGGLFMSSAVGGVGTVVAMMLVFIAIVCVVALPVDALLIALTVIATDKAVRGEPVRFGEVFEMARKRILAVCRLTLTFYAMFSVPQFLITGLTSLLAGMVSPVFFLVTLASFVFFFILGILLSMSPIVLVVEGRGVVDSLKRSVELCKPAWGRLLAIHALWAVCVVPLMVISFLIMFNPVLYAIAIAFLLAYVRTLQMLIYTDLRMRQERYDRELLEDWTRNVRRQGAV